MIDRTEIQYQIGEIARVMPGWVDSEKAARVMMELRKKELETAKKRLAEATTKWREKKDYIDHLDELREEYTKALDDLLDEPEAVQAFKDNLAFVNKESMRYDFQEAEPYLLIKKALYTIGCKYAYNDTGRYILLKFGVPDSYAEFIFGVEKDVEVQGAAVAPPPTPLKTSKKRS